MTSLKIPVDKIREVIGSGGKVIQKICAECDVKIDIEENGDVFVSGIDRGQRCPRSQHDSKPSRVTRRSVLSIKEELPV